MKLANYMHCLLGCFIVACSSGRGVLEIPPDSIEEVESSEDTAWESSTLEPAGDYRQPGAWVAATSTVDVTGRGGNALVTQVWFPATEAGLETAEYGWAGASFTGEAYTDLAPDCTEPRPVMIHSHGNSSINIEMFYLPEFLATHGWIVAAPDHTGNTLYDGSASFDDLLSRRPFDLQDTFDWLVAQSEDPANPLYGCVEADDGYVSSGYSFGGYTAYVNGGALVNQWWVPTLDYSDDRVRGVIAFAPWNAWGYLSSGTSEIQAPVLTIGGDSDMTVGSQYRDLHGYVASTPRAMASFPYAGHFSFTPIYCVTWGNGCGPYYVDETVMTDFVKTSVLAFSEHIRGRDGAIDQMPVEDGNFTWSYAL